MVRIYYHNDMDGIASCEIIKWACSNLINGIGVQTYHMNYGPKDAEYLAEANPGDIVYIVDYSFTDNTISVFRKLYYTVTTERTSDQLIWIDHHDSSIEFIDKYANANKDNCEFKNGFFYASKEGSGAYLCYKLHGLYPWSKSKDGIKDNVFERVIPLWVRYISDYDTFTLTYTPESEWFKLAFDQKENQHRAIADLLNAEVPNTWGGPRFAYYDHILREFMKDGKILKDYIDTENKIILRASGYESYIPLEDGEKIPIYVCNRMSNSWVFGEKYNEYPYVVVYFFDGKDYRYSMFSNLKIFNANCKQFAEAWGGGGHLGAAGWRAANLMFKKGEFIPRIAPKS